MVLEKNERTQSQGSANGSFASVVVADVDVVSSTDQNFGGAFIGFLLTACVEVGNHTS